MKNFLNSFRIISLGAVIICTIVFFSSCNLEPKGGIISITNAFSEIKQISIVGLSGEIHWYVIKSGETKNFDVPDDGRYIINYGGGYKVVNVKGGEIVNVIIEP